MDAFIKLSPNDQRLFCKQAESKLNLPPASIEKDFWVCWTLRELFNLPGWGGHLSFKGGTSLAKAWKLIERFSEDIDVVIDREFLGFGGETLSGKRQKKLIKKCSEKIHHELRPAMEVRFKAVLPPTAKWTLTPADAAEDKDQQTLLFEYPGVLTGKATYLRPVVKIEMGGKIIIMTMTTHTTMTMTATTSILVISDMVPVVGLEPTRRFDALHFEKSL